MMVLNFFIGLIGNLLKVKPTCNRDIPEHHIEQETHSEGSLSGKKKSLWERIKSVLKYACIDMPREIGLETMAGLALAALVSTIPMIGRWIKNYLTRRYAYLFALVFGLIVYMCVTMSIPLVDAFINQGNEYRRRVVFTCSGTDC